MIRAAIRAALVAVVLLTAITVPSAPMADAQTAPSTFEFEFDSCIGVVPSAECEPLLEGSLASPSSVVVSPDGDTVWTASYDDDTVAWFTRSPDGRLTFGGCVNNHGADGCVDLPAAPIDEPSDLAVSPDGDSLWVAAAASNAIVHFHAGPDGTLNFGGCVSNTGDGGCADLPNLPLALPVALAVSPDGSSLWAAGYISATVVHFHAAPEGQLTFGGCVANADTTGCANVPGTPMEYPSTLAVSPDGDSLWVGSDTAGTVVHLHAAPAGQLTFGGCVSGSTVAGCADLSRFLLRPTSLAVTPDGTSLYVASRSTDSIVHLRAAPAGQLTFGGCVSDEGSEGCTNLPDEPLDGVEEIVVGPDGGELFAAARGTGAVTQLSIGDGGDLSFAGCLASGDSTSCAAAPSDVLAHAHDLATSPDGDSIYTTTVITSRLVHLRRTPVATPGPTSGSSRFVPLTPARVFDTRPDAPGAGPKGRVPAGGTIDVQVTGVSGVPASGVTAVVLNITATEAGGAGFVTVWPSGTTRPLASSLNLTGPGQTRPNLVTVPVGADGRISLYAHASVHLLGDVAGYYTAVTGAVGSGRLLPIAPARVFDTRPGEPAPGPKGFVAAGAAIDVQITGVAGVPPSGVSAAVLNVTATGATAAGFVTVWPTGLPRPLASNLNLNGPDETAPNLVVVPVGPDGKVSFYSHAGTHLLADVTGYYTDGTATPSLGGLFVPLQPMRAFDTRPGTAAPGPKGSIAAGGVITTVIGGVAGVPAGAAAVALNLTATEVGGTGFVTTWPAGGPRPLASTLNVVPGDTRPNSAIMPLGVGGSLAHYSHAPAHLLADVAGYFTPAPPVG